MHFDAELWPVSRHNGWIEDDAEKGLVSVVVPTFNRSDLVVSTLDSVSEQSYRPIELIVVDDGSTDKTPLVLETWKKSHESEGFRVICLSQENAGAQVARNRGAIHSTGEFIQFLDSDDLLDSEKLRLSVECLVEKPGVDIVIGVPIQMSDGKSVFPHHPSDENWNEVEAISAAIRGMGTCTSFFRRTALAVLGPWDEALTCAQDFEYAIRSKCARAEVEYIPEAIYYKEDRIGDSITAKRSRQQKSTAASIAHVYQRLAEYVPRGFLSNAKYREYVAREIFGVAIQTPGMTSQARARLLRIVAKWTERRALRLFARSSSLSILLTGAFGLSLSRAVLNLRSTST